MQFYDLLIKKSKEDGISKNVVGGIIVNQKGEILIMTRKSDDFMGGIEELPSGNMEENETIYEALKREIKEETNLDVVEVKGYINSFDYTSSSALKARQFNFALITNDTTDIKLTEHDSYKWLSITEVQNNSKITDEVKYSIEIYYFNFINKNN